MSKLSRHAAIRAAVTRQKVASQDDLRRLLYRSGHRVTQATLSRDIRDLGLVKSSEGYTFPNGNDDAIDPYLPSVEKLIRDFVYEVKAAQNLVVVKTSAGSAQPVAAAIDAEEWPEIIGTVAGDDVILAVTPDNKIAEKFVNRIKGLLA